MSTPIVPGPSHYWPPAATPAAPPPRRRKLRWIAVGAALVIVLAAGITALIAFRPTDPAPPAQAIAPPPAATTAAAVGATTPAPSVTPEASDFKLTAKITRKKCFGSAGCNIDFWIKMAYGGPDLNPADTWVVTYEVRGVEDGPQVNTIEVTGDTYSHDETESASTSSSSKKLTVKVTDVEKQGV